MSDEARKGKTSVSVIDSEEALRNIADRVDSNGVREPGIFELLSAIQMNTRFAGIVTEPIVVLSGTSAVSLTKLVFCPGGSRIIVFDVAFSVLGTASASFTDAAGNDIMGSLKSFSANGVTTSKSSVKGFTLPKNTSLFFTTDATAAWDVEISYALIPTRV